MTSLAPPDSSRTAVDRVVDELRRALFDGELEPGTPLREVALAESLGVARSTVREALRLLVAEGLAVRIANRGTQVRTPDPAAIIDVTRARLVLEIAGVRHWHRAEPADRQAVLDAMTAYAALAKADPSAADLNAAHLRIHRSFVGLNGSQRLTSACDLIHAEIRLALARVDRIKNNLLEQVDSHQLLIDLLRDDRIDDAADELHRHLSGAEEVMLEQLGLS